MRHPIEYKITPTEEGATYAIEIWTHTLASQKRVRLEITTTYRSGEFTLEMCETERAKLIFLDKISFQDFPGTCCEEVSGELRHVTEICDKAQYTPLEIDEIDSLMQPDTDESDLEYDYPESVLIVMTLEANGWTLEDTVYGLHCSCNVEPTN
jgi:hypothetical protein